MNDDYKKLKMAREHIVAARDLIFKMYDAEQASSQLQSAGQAIDRMIKSMEIPLTPTQWEWKCPICEHVNYEDKEPEDAVRCGGCGEEQPIRRS